MNGRRPGKSITGIGNCPSCREDNVVFDKRLRDMIICVGCRGGLELIESQFTDGGISVLFTFIRSFSGYGRCPNCWTMLNLENIVGYGPFACINCSIKLVILVHIGNPSRGVLTLGRTFSAM